VIEHKLSVVNSETENTNAPVTPAVAARHEPRAGRNARCVALFVSLILGVLVADLLLKAWSFDRVAGRSVVFPEDLRGSALFDSIPAHEPWVVLPYVLNLRLTLNTGAVFGLGKGGRSFFVLVSVVAVGAIGWVFWHSAARAKLHHLALALILGGALGNLYDRLRFGAVRDMMHLFPDVHLPWGLAWPGGNTEVYPWIFNLADVALVVGVLLLFVVMWQHEKQQQQKQAEQTAPS
jgi:signal peptidase II